VGITKMAGGAFLGGYDAGMVFVRIHGEHPWRAELDANMATLAPGGIDEDFAVRAFLGRQRRVLRLTGICNNIVH